MDRFKVIGAFAAVCMVAPLALSTAASWAATPTATSPTGASGTTTTNVPCSSTTVAGPTSTAKPLPTATAVDSSTPRGCSGSTPSTTISPSTTTSTTSTIPCATTTTTTIRPTTLPPTSTTIWLGCPGTTTTSSTVLPAPPSTDAPPVSLPSGAPSTVPPPTPTTTPNPCPKGAPPYFPVSEEVLDSKSGRGCWSMVATGDSVTSAHIQTTSGIATKANPCPNTIGGVTGVGNAWKSSYARIAFKDARFSGGDYFNFARTGFTTSDMLNATATTLDACSNRWIDTLRNKDNPVSPFYQMLQATAFEHAQNQKVAWVSSGGVNDTNWVGVLQDFGICNALRTAVGKAGGRLALDVTPLGSHKFRVNDSTLYDTVMADLLLRGGTCTLWTQPFSGVYSPRVLPTVKYGTFGVRKFDLAEVAPGISGRVAYMVRNALAQGVDKIVWVGYYDMAMAQMDKAGALANLSYGLTEGGFLPTVRDSILAAISAYLPSEIPMFNTQALRNAVHDTLTQLDKAICDGVKNGAAGNPAATCLDWTAPGFSTALQTQATAMGGSPHPSDAGHKAIGAAVVKALG